MAGLVSPVGGFVQGMRLADQDQRVRDEEERRKREFESSQELRGLQTQGARMAVEESQKNLPIADMRRKADIGSMLATQFLQTMDAIPDDNLDEAFAELMTLAPIGQEYKYKDGQVLNPKTQQWQPFKLTRDFIKSKATEMAKPELMFEKIKEEMAENLYVGADGKPIRTNKAAAQQAGLTLAQDVVDGHKISTSATEAKYADEAQRLGLAAKRAQIAAANRSGVERPTSAMYVGPDGKTVTMGLNTDLAAMREKGYRPAEEVIAEAKLNSSPEVDIFSKQAPGAIEGDVYDAVLADQGYQYDMVQNELGGYVKMWSKGGVQTQISPEDHISARKIATMATSLLSRGEARSVPEARARAEEKLNMLMQLEKVFTERTGKSANQDRNGFVQFIDDVQSGRVDPNAPTVNVTR